MNNHHLILQIFSPEKLISLNINQSLKENNSRIFHFSHSLLLAPQSAVYN